MSTGTVYIDNKKDLSCMTTIQSSGFVDSKALSLKGNILFESNVGAGDGHTAELVKSGFEANTSKDMEEAASFQDESIAAELFANVLGSVKRKLEEDGYEWKTSPTPDAETAASKVDCLISKLKRRFNDEKQVRADTIKPSYSQYIFSNSVDAFLRYHEKPKVDIHYSESDVGIQGEGLYSFAVKPSRIRKRRKDTFGTLEESTNVCAASHSADIHTGLGNSGEDSSENSVKLSNTVSATQNTDAAGDVFYHKNTVICNAPSVYKASDLIVSLISKCTAPESVNSRVISPTNHFQKSEKVDDCVVPPISKMMVFEEVLPITVAIATPPDPYFSTIIPIFKVQSYTKANDHTIPSMREYHSPDENNGFVMLPFHRANVGHAIPLIFKYHSPDKTNEFVLLAFHKLSTHYCIPSMLAYRNSDKNFNPVISAFYRITLSMEINGLVYKADMLVNMFNPKRRICDNAKHSLYKKPISIEISDHNLCLMHNVSPDEDFCGHCVPAIFRLIKVGEFYVNMIHLIGAFQKIEEAGTKKICKMPVPTLLRMSGIKEIYGHSVPQICYILTAKESESCATTPIHSMTLTEKINGYTMPGIYKVGTHPYKDVYDKTVYQIIKRVTLQKIPGKAVTPIFKTRLLKEVYVDVPQEYKSTPEEVHDHENVPIDDVSAITNISDSTVTADNKGHTVVEVDEIIYDTIIDEFDDDSPFGIMSIYCNSKIHSRCGKMLEAER